MIGCGSAGTPPNAHAERDKRHPDRQRTRWRPLPPMSHAASICWRAQASCVAIGIKSFSQCFDVGNAVSIRIVSFGLGRRKGISERTLIKLYEASGAQVLAKRRGDSAEPAIGTVVTNRARRRCLRLRELLYDCRKVRSRIGATGDANRAKHYDCANENRVARQVRSHQRYA